ncbi:MAG: peptide deformylase, partial [Candidatus Dactylopiibacterium carminicum]
MIHTLLRMGDPRLLQRAREVESFGAPELYALVADMFETMAQAGGVGLAAPQIGVDLRVIVLGMEHRVGRGEKPDG